jgi:hypothetical protein
MRISRDPEEAADLAAALERARAHGTARQYPTFEGALALLARVVEPTTARAKIVEMYPDAPAWPVVLAYVSPTRFLKVGAWHAISVHTTGGQDAVAILVVLDETALAAVVTALRPTRGGD